MADISNFCWFERGGEERGPGGGRVSRCNAKP